jgi:hypothetical protein
MYSLTYSTLSTTQTKRHNENFHITIYSLTRIILISYNLLKNT